MSVKSCAGVMIRPRTPLTQVLAVILPEGFRRPSDNGPSRQCEDRLEVRAGDLKQVVAVDIEVTKTVI
jgi:hypothetical protein